MAQLLKPLISIGQYSCKLDAKSMAFIWKLLLKMLQQNPDLSRKLELGTSLLFLVQEILRLFDLLRQNVNNVSKLTKIAGFLIKVVVGLVEKDDTILEGEKENEAALTLILHLLKYFKFSCFKIKRLIITQILFQVHARCCEVRITVERGPSAPSRASRCHSRSPTLRELTQEWTFP